MAPRWPQGQPEADTGARWPRSCAAASGTPCALARGHRGLGNGIKQRETDGTPSPGRGNEGRVESRQEKSFSGWSENYLLEEEEEEAAANGPQLGPPHRVALPARGVPRAPGPQDSPTPLKAREGRAEGARVSLPFDTTLQTSLLSAPRLGLSSRPVPLVGRALAPTNSPGKTHSLGGRGLTSSSLLRGAGAGTGAGAGGRGRGKGEGKGEGRGAPWRLPAPGARPAPQSPPLQSPFPPRFLPPPRPASLRPASSQPSPLGKLEGFPLLGLQRPRGVSQPQPLRPRGVPPPFAWGSRRLAGRLPERALTHRSWHQEWPDPLQTPKGDTQGRPPGEACAQSGRLYWDEPTTAVVTWACLCRAPSCCLMSHRGQGNPPHWVKRGTPPFPECRAWSPLGAPPPHPASRRPPGPRGRHVFCFGFILTHIGCRAIDL